MKRKKIRKVNFKLKNRIRKSSLPKTHLFRGSKKILNMNWVQAKRRFPGLSPTDDSDFDGTINRRDCKPFDPARDGKVGKLLKKIYKAIPETRKKTSVKKSAGRPKATFEKRLHPITGKIMPPMAAKKWYKLKKSIIREYQSRQESQAERVQKLMEARLARRGIPPTQAEQIVDERIAQQIQQLQPQEEQVEEEPGEIPTQEEIEPQQVPIQARAMPMGRHLPPGYQQMPDGTIVRMQRQMSPEPQFHVIEDLMVDGRKIIRPNPYARKEAWLN